MRPSGGIGERGFAEVAGLADVLAGRPIRGELQAHLRVALVAQRSPGPTPGSLLVRNNGRSFPATVGAAVHRRPSARAGPVCRHARRSDAAEGVSAGRRPCPVQIDRSGRRGHSPACSRLSTSPPRRRACVRARPVVGGRRSAVARSPCAHRFANAFPCPLRRDRSGMAAFAIRVGVALAVAWRGVRPAAATHSLIAALHGPGRGAAGQTAPAVPVQPPVQKRPAASVRLIAGAPVALVDHARGERPGRDQVQRDAFGERRRLVFAGPAVTRA